MSELIMIFFAYLAGSIPTGVWYSTLIHRVDVRNLGSGNSGGTNIARNFGPLAAIIVITVDVLKGYLPLIISQHYFLPESSWVVIATAIASVLGHAYPLFANFKGGKIVATTIGVLLAFNAQLALIIVLIFALCLFLFSMVSLAALLALLVGVIYIILNYPPLYGVGFSLIYIFLMYRHRQNIQRILHGEERKISFGLKGLLKHFNHQ